MKEWLLSRNLQEQKMNSIRLRLEHIKLGQVYINELIKL
jgi:hypothetical protein